MNRLLKFKTNLTNALENKNIKLSKNILTNFGNQLLPSMSAILSGNPVGLLQILTTQTLTSARNFQKTTKQEQQKDKLQRDTDSKKRKLGFTQDIDIEKLAEQSLSLRVNAKALRYIIDTYPALTAENTNQKILKEFQKQKNNKRRNAK